MELLSSVRAVPASRLLAWYAEVFSLLGVPATDARIVAETLLYADLRGIDTHGVERLAMYVDRIQGGGTNPVTRLEKLADHGAVATYSANDGLGQVAAARAMDETIERARENGVSLVAVRDSNHLGALGFYAELAVPHDMIGFALSGVASTLAPVGGRRAVLGSNPCAVAIPAGPQGPLVVDMAHGATITTRLRQASVDSEEIPRGQAIDEHGHSTTDPDAALRGAILPFGGHKGFALALVLEVLSSVLTGALYSTDLPTYQEGVTQSKKVGHLLMAVQVRRFLDPEDFSARVADLLARVKSAGEEGGVRLPGERRLAEMSRRTTTGIPIAASVVRRIESIAADLGVPSPV